MPRQAWSLALLVVATIPALAQEAKPAPLTVTGYLTTSFTSASRDVEGTIVGRLYGRHHNGFMVNVGDLVFERVPAVDRWDAGFRFEPVFGQNAAVVKSIGLDLGTHADIWQAYVTLNLPAGSGSYWQLKAGKMATLMGLEVFEDVLNPNLDVGSQDIFLEAFTETGAQLEAHFGSKIDAELRITNGWDLVSDNNTAKSFVGRLGITPDAATSIALLGYAGPEQVASAHNVRSGAQVLVGHKFGNKVGSWLQLDYGQERGAVAPDMTAKWSAAGLWFSVDMSANLGLGLRGDYVNDRDGARTSGGLGFPVHSGQKLTSMTATLNIKRWDHALLRPEIRFDHSSLPVFDGHQAQVSLALGMSYLF